MPGKLGKIVLMSESLDFRDKTSLAVAVQTVEVAWRKSQTVSGESLDPESTRPHGERKAVA